MVAEIELPACGVCGKEPGVGVASMPGIPMSISYGAECLQKGLSYPYSMLVINTSLAGGMEGAADWWKEEVEFHLPFFEKTMSEFLDDVNKSIQEEIEYWKEEERKAEGLPEREYMDPPEGGPFG